MSRCAVTLVLLLLLVCPHLAYAKRTAAPNVEPVVYDGVRLKAPNDKGSPRPHPSLGYEERKKVWEVTVFHTLLKTWMEKCVHWVFIEEMRIVNGKLIVFAERDHVYSVDLTRRSVHRVKSVSSTSARE